MFTLGELASAAEAGVPVILMVLMNGGYGEIRSAMIAQNVPPLGVDLFVPDLAAIAAASGWAVAEVADPGGLRATLAEASGRRGPTMLLYDQRLRAALTP
jgi:acetolactate synthase-1/2/3 large subunit